MSRRDGRGDQLPADQYGGRDTPAEALQENRAGGPGQGRHKHEERAQRRGCEDRQVGPDQDRETAHAEGQADQLRRRRVIHGRGDRQLAGRQRATGQGDL